jgi:hypothetical protein
VAVTENRHAVKADFISDVMLTTDDSNRIQNTGITPVPDNTSQ